MKQQRNRQLKNMTYQHSLEEQLEIIRHGERVRLYSLLLAQYLNIHETTIEKIKIAAREHDAGKKLCPPHILYKPDALTEKEKIVIQCHSRNSTKLYAENYSEKIDIDIAKGIRGHHENYDGSGYPDGLKGSNIPYIARIIRITDTFDALTQERCYKKAIPCEEALGTILYSHILYDPEMVRIFVENFDAFVDLYRAINDSTDITELW